MKNHIKTIAALAVLALALAAPAQAQTAQHAYARVGLEYTQFTAGGNGFDNLTGWKLGYAIEGGYAFSPAQTLGLEISYVTNSGNAAGLASGISIKKQQLPILLAYKYHFLTGSIATPYVGASAGLMQDKFSMDSGTPQGTGSDTNWLFVYGLTGGCDFAIGHGWYANAGIRYLVVSQKSYAIGNNGVTIPSRTYGRPTFTLGIGYNW